MSEGVPDKIGVEGYGHSGKRLFQAIMAQSPDHIYIKDLNSRFVAISQQMAISFGLESADEAIGKTDRDFFTEEHANQALEDEQRILQTGKPVLAKEEKETWPDGSETWVSTTKAPIFLSSGKIVGLIGISRDVTRIHQANEAIAASQEQLRERDARIRKDLQSASHVQQVFLPGDIPDLPGVDIALVLDAMDEVGGDVITFPESPDGNLLFFIGDVTGHGVTAGLFTLLVKYLTDRHAEQYEGNLQEYLQKINEGLVGRIPDGFVVGMCGELIGNPQSGFIFRASNAGHREFIHYHASSGQAEIIHLPLGYVLGLPLEAGSEDAEFRLQRGDRLLFFTDGIIETRNPEGEEFGCERTARAFQDAAHLDSEAVLQAIVQAGREFSRIKAPSDDLSLLLLSVES